MKIMVTGAGGFLGSSVCEILENERYELIKIGNRDSKRKNVGFFDELIDLSDADSVNLLGKYESVDVLIHCAGLAHQFGKVERRKFFEINVEGTAKIIELCQRIKIKRFILISSAAVYGKLSNFSGLTGNTEESVLNPQGFYAESKYESEQKAINLCRKYQINLTILRPATIVGENDKGNMRRLIEAFKNKKFVMIGQGKNKKSLIYKRDAARACLEIVRQSKETLEIYNLSANPLTVREIVNIIADSFEKKRPKLIIPEKLAIKGLNVFTKILKNEKLETIHQTVEKWLADDIFPAEKIKNKYGFVPVISAREALQRECRQFSD